MTVPPRASQRARKVWTRAEYFDTFYVSYFERQGQNDLKAKLSCLEPVPMLAAPLERSQSTIFFSATSLPIDFFMKVLTSTTEYPRRIFQSPFPIANIGLLIHNGISTKYVQRADSYVAIASATESICSPRGQLPGFLPVLCISGCGA